MIPFSFHLILFSGVLFIVKSGLCHIGELMCGVSSCCVSVLICHQAVRVGLIVMFLKRLFCLIFFVINGRSDIVISLHSACSNASHGFWELSPVIHLQKY